MIVIDEYLAVRVLRGDRWPEELPDAADLVLPTSRYWRLLQRIHAPAGGQLSALLARAVEDWRAMAGATTTCRADGRKHAFAPPAVDDPRTGTTANTVLPAQRPNLDLWPGHLASETWRHDFYVAVGAGSQTAVLVHNCPTVKYDPNDDGLGDDAPSGVQKIGQEYGQQPNDVQNSKWSSALKAACSDCGVEYSEDCRGNCTLNWLDQKRRECPSVNCVQCSAPGSLVAVDDVDH